MFNGDLTVVPFGRWQYEWSITKDNKRKLKLVNGCQTPIWWKNYNDVKHQRIGLITGTKNFTKANQHNLILAFSALFLLEYLFMSNNFTIVPSIRNSKLFTRIVDDK